MLLSAYLFLQEILHIWQRFGAKQSWYGPGSASRFLRYDGPKAYNHIFAK